MWGPLPSLPPSSTIPPRALSRALVSGVTTHPRTVPLGPWFPACASGRGGGSSCQWLSGTHVHTGHVWLWQQKAGSASEGRGLCRPRSRFRSWVTKPQGTLGPSGLRLGLANYGLWAWSSPLPVFYTAHKLRMGFTFLNNNQKKNDMSWNVKILHN